MYLDRLGTLYLQASSWLQAQTPMRQPTMLALNDFDWDSTPAHKHFVWHSCFGNFKCARLEVPMDWQGNSSEANKTVELAVVKVEAAVPVTDATYGGAVVLNPGGPGGSGVGQVLRGGHHVRTVLSAGPEADEDSAKHFDIIGFDPRGINNTRPLLACFPDHLASAAWTIEEHAHGMLGTSDTSFDNLWAGKRALAEGCSKRAAEEGVAKHMDTAPVARDIIEIFERHGEWREAEAKRLVKANVVPLEVRSDAEQRTRYIPGKEVVQYWGFSYGTILGATLSAMFPDRIHRAVLDGVADARDYMAGGWSTNLVDTDLTFVKLAEYCYEGGVEHCPLWHEDGPAFIAADVQKIFADFRTNPIAVPGNSTHGPQIVTFDDLKHLIRDIVYNPLRDFPPTAKIIYEVGQGNGTALAAWKLSQQPNLGDPISEQCKKDGPYSPSCFPPSGGMIWDATYAIACSDGLPRTDMTKEEYREYANNIMGQSRLIGESWATIQLPCTAWHARPNWRYNDDYGLEEPIKTAHPIMFVGNTIDPVTPLRNAFLMAKGFEGAAVLHQDSEGHCTYASPSMCSGRVLREYFQAGMLAESKTVCEPNRLPFDGYSEHVMPNLPEGETDEALWDALVGLNRVWP